MEREKKEPCEVEEKEDNLYGCERGCGCGGAGNGNEDSDWLMYADG